MTEDEAALKKENRLLVRRKVTDALGSLYGFTEVLNNGYGKFPPSSKKVAE